MVEEKNAESQVSVPLFSMILIRGVIPCWPRLPRSIEVEKNKPNRGSIHLYNAFALSIRSLRYYPGNFHYLENWVTAFIVEYPSFRHGVDYVVFYFFPWLRVSTNYDKQERYSEFNTNNNNINNTDKQNLEFSTPPPFISYVHYAGVLFWVLAFGITGPCITNTRHLTPIVLLPARRVLDSGY